MPHPIYAPWTPEQVDALNRFQRAGGMHPFTCGGVHWYANPTLIARTDGWHCPQTTCEYRQDWAHDFMADPAQWPRSPFGERHGPAPQEMAASLYTVPEATIAANAVGAGMVGPSQLVIDGSNGRPLVTINLDDGTLEYGPGYAPDEAARHFWNAVLDQMPDRARQ